MRERILVWCHKRKKKRNLKNEILEEMCLIRKRLKKFNMIKFKNNYLELMDISESKMKSINTFFKILMSKLNLS